MKKETDIYSEERRRVLEPSQKGYTPKNCIAKTKQDCFYFQCIHNSQNGGECTQEKELPADGIELRHKVKVERIDRTTFRDWPKIIEQTAKLIKQREVKNGKKISIALEKKVVR